MALFSNHTLLRRHLLSSIRSNAVSERSPSDAGFSLLESIVVVAIVGLLGAIAAPGWLALMTNQRLGSVQDEIVQAVRTAQSTAKQTRRSTELDFKMVDGSLPAISIAGRSFQNVGNGELEPGMLYMQVSDQQGILSKLTFDQDGTLDQDASLDFPVSILLSASPTSGPKRCIFIETILGGVRTEANGDCP